MASSSALPAGGLPKPIQWPGGKGNMVAKLLPLVPYGPQVRVYVEPYCGGASLFFAKPRPHPVEVLNDLDQRVVALFRALQDKETFEELKHRLRYTPYARAEFERALRVLEEGGSLADTAWALFVAANQSVSAAPRSVGNWSRAFIITGSVANNINKWLMRLSMLDDWHRRLLMAQIDCRDALEVIRYWDSEATFFYLDPPYVPDTRRGRRIYAVEADLAHHEALAQLLLGLKGAALLSGYRHPVYEPLERAGWERRDWQTASYMAPRLRGHDLQGSGAILRKAPRVESAWLSPKLQEWLRASGNGAQHQQPLMLME